MTPRAAVQQVARMVRDDIRSGGLSPGAHSIADMLVEQPEALLLIVDLAGSEGRKKRPDAMMHHAYSVMLGNTLEQLRQRSEAGKRSCERGHREYQDHDRSADTRWQARADGSAGACLGVFAG